MQLVIKDFKWGEQVVDRALLKDISHKICNKLEKEYSVKTRCIVDSDAFIFKPTDTKGNKEYLFTSIKENKISLTPGGTMAKKLGRDYMVSHRLTKKQWEAVNSCILGTLKKLKINYTALLDDVIINDGWESPNKFTEEMV